MNDKVIKVNNMTYYAWITLWNLYEQLGRMRDECIEICSSIKDPESKQQYDGRATAYDTVRGKLFAIIGEDDESEVHK